MVCGNWDTGNTCILTPRISMEDARGCVSLSSSSGLRGGHDGCMSPSGYRVHRGMLWMPGKNHLSCPLKLRRLVR